MVDDSVLVALIAESLNTSNRNRRLAALVILDVLRNGAAEKAPRLEIIEAEAVPAVADEIRTLLERYHLHDC